MNIFERAQQFDEADALAAWRDCFVIPEGIVYLDGNSLGALPRATPGRIEEVTRAEWGEGLIRSWNDAGWVDAPLRIGAKIAPLIGAAPEEVIACDSTSVNLFKLIAAALDLRAGRKVVLSEPGNFPTDIYMIEGLARQGLAEPRLVQGEGLIEALDGDVALLLLTHVHYKTGAIHDMVRLTRAAHAAGALVLWDLSHSAGALPLDLAGCGVDMAVGCGYKYLCGGPGAPAFAYVAKRHHPDLRQPLTGWFGHAEPFSFEDSYRPAQGIARLQSGTPPIIGLAALEVGVDLIAGIGVEALAEKSRALSEFFLDCLSVLAGEPGGELELASPASSLERGSQLSFRHPHAHALCQALIARGVIGDFRAKDILRLGFAPAYLRFVDIAQAASHLADILSSRAWDDPRFDRRSKVT